MENLIEKNLIMYCDENLNERTAFWAIKVNKCGRYESVLLFNEIRRINFQDEDINMNRSDYVFETIKLLVIYKFYHDTEKAQKYIRRVNYIMNKISSFEIAKCFPVDKDFYKESKLILNASKKLSNDLCGDLNELQ